MFHLLIVHTFCVLTSRVIVQAAAETLFTGLVSNTQGLFHPLHARMCKQLQKMAL